MIIQSTEKAGTVTLTASGAGLASHSILIETR